MKIKKVFKSYIIYIIIFFIGIFKSGFSYFYETIIFNKDLVMILVTLIAGLFGFIIAIIPFAIQVFNKKYDKNSIEEFIKFVEPMLKRFIKTLNILLRFFIFLFILYIIQIFKDDIFKFIELEIYKNIFITVIFTVYTLNLFKFIEALNNIIRDSDTMISIFIKEKKDIK